MEGLFSYKSFDKKKEQDIDLSNQPDLLEQARQYYLTMSGPHTTTRSNQSSKTPPPCRPPQIQRSNQPQVTDNQYFSDNLTTNSQPEDHQTEPSEKTLDESLRISTGRPSSGRRLRSERTRGKTPTATQITANADPNRDLNHLKSSYHGIQTMDDFANMLLAKHESNRQQQYIAQVSTYQPESRTNLFAKVPYMVTVNDEDQSLPEIVSQVQMLDNSTLPLDDSDFNSSPRRDQIKPYVKTSPIKTQHETSLEFAVQKIQVIEDVSQEDSSSYCEQINIQETRQVAVAETVKHNYGYLTSIKEFNESQENMVTEQTTSPSHQVEYTSLRCDENEHLEIERQEDSSQKQPLQQELVPAQNEVEFQSHCEENFASQSPIKKFLLEDNQDVRDASPKSPSGLASPDKAEDHDLNNQTNDDLAQGLSDQMLREENEQLQAQIEQLSTQLIQAQSTIGSLERQISAKDIQHMQDQLRHDQLNQQLEMQKTQHELHVTQLIETNTLTTHKLHHDFEVKKQVQNEENEKVVTYLRAALAHSQEQVKNLEAQFKQREQVTIKLRQDNQNMFADLKQLAQSEQHLKFELEDAKSVIQELEAHSQQLTDSLKHQNQQFSEQMKNQQQQMELIKQQTNKAIKDTIQESERQQKESQQREQQLMQEIQSLLEQNQLLANKAQSLEQERLNITTERERKNNELRQMHQELQKMTTVINGMKQMQVSNFESNVSGPYFGQRGQSAGKTPSNLMTSQMLQQRQVLHQADLNMEWTNQYSQQQQQSEVRPQSPFKKVSVTPHPVSSPSPLKGRMDPNMAQYARRQNLNITNQQQDFESIVQEMTLQEMQGTKSKMEAEYARIPIILTGKSLQIRKRKEELEYELDLIEKYINRAKQNRL